MTVTARLARSSTPTTPFVRAALAVERASALDPLTSALAPAAAALVGSPARRDALQGRWLGHSLHPLLVMVPLGSWTAVSLLDAVGGDDLRPAARLLTGFGILGALPSAVTGLAEYADANQRDRRTAAVHAVANSVGLACYARSWWLRRRGEHARGARLAAAGLGATSVGGFLGTHLAQARKVGSFHPAFSGR